MASVDQLRHVADRIMGEMLMQLGWNVRAPGQVVDKARALGIDLEPDETAAVYDLLERADITYTLPDETAEYTDGFRAGYHGLNEDDSNPEWIRGFVDGQGIHLDGDRDMWATARKNEAQP